MKGRRAKMEVRKITKGNKKVCVDAKKSREEEKRREVKNE